MRASLRSFRVSCSGTSAIEFGLIIPVLLVFVGGVVEMGRAWQTYVAVNRLATRYAIAWADCSDPNNTGVCATEMALYTTAAAEQNIAPQLVPVSGISLRMMQLAISPSGTTVNPASPGGATPTASELAVAQNTIPTGQTGKTWNLVVVTVSYTYTPMFFASIAKPFLGTGKTFTYTAAQLKS